jgi:hypothetical protein
MDLIFNDYRSNTRTTPKLVIIGSGIEEIDSMNKLEFDTLAFSPNSSITSLPEECFFGVSAKKIYLPARLRDIPQRFLAASPNLVYTNTRI